MQNTKINTFWRKRQVFLSSLYLFPYTFLSCYASQSLSFSLTYDLQLEITFQMEDVHQFNHYHKKAFLSASKSLLHYTDVLDLPFLSFSRRSFSFSCATSLTSFTRKQDVQMTWRRRGWIRRRVRWEDKESEDSKGDIIRLKTTADRDTAVYSLSFNELQFLLFFLYHWPWLAMFVEWFRFSPLLLSHA